MIDILNPLTIPAWDEMLLQTPGTTIFHTSHWARVLHESYGYKPLYFSEIENGRFKTLIPVMEINSIITGKRGVSLPFTDYIDPIFEGEFHRVLAEIVDYGKKAGWRSVELRSRNELPEGVLASARYYGHTIDLLQGEKKLFSNLRDSTRRNIRKAVAEGVKVRQRTDLDAVKDFYRLNCLTRRDHGLPPQPWAFFKKVHEHVMAKNYGTVVTASHNGRSIASSVFFSSGAGVCINMASRTGSFRI